MTEKEHHSPETGGQSEGPPEPDRPPMGQIFGLVAGLSLVVLVVVLGLWQLFKHTVRDEIYRKELSLQNSELVEARARDRARLTQYALLDPERGVYQIPIERAMDKLLRHPELVRTIPTARPTATSQPAATSQPTTQPTTPTTQPTAGQPAPKDQTKGEEGGKQSQ
jgi:hypothetical protein